MKARKIDKEFLLTDESVNVYGYRLLTGGYQMDRYLLNPIGYRMHNRDAGVILRWEDLRMDGDKVYGKPVINMSHPMGQQTADEVENGFLNAASMGGIVALEYDESDALKLPGQVGPTITKWFNKEISLVDIPGNANALAQLYDKDDRPIDLADFIGNNLESKSNPTIKNKMSLKSILIRELDLADNSDDQILETAIRSLVDKAKKADTLAQDLADLKASTIKKEVDDIVARALKEKRITREIADRLADDYATNPSGLSALVSGLKPYQSVVDKIEDKSQDVLPEKFKGKTIMELHAEDLLDELKNKFPELYATMWSEFKNPQ